MSHALTFHTPSRGASAARASRGPHLPHVFADLNRTALRVIEKVELWSARRAQRRALLGLPDHLIRDIGLSRADVYGEAGKAVLARVRDDIMKRPGRGGMLPRPDRICVSAQATGHVCRSGGVVHVRDTFHA